ncbi:hypothetical protein BJF84_15625 [Rhodococcus sp. CUA-806]|nr:hypothetical protein BJF84_26055 [Rhodococcus sp. CUA-806]OLT34986.1 hypothetical protein BJF84_15625 [Rhodococcus sp. CUA-806]
MWIGRHHRIRIRIPAYSTHTRSPAQLWEQWSAVLQFPDHHPSTALLAEQLQCNRFVQIRGSANTTQSCRGFDRSVGTHTVPIPPETRDAIAAVVHAYLIDTPPQRKARRSAHRRDDDENT